MNMIDLTPLANALIAVAAALLSTFAVPWLRARAKGTQTENLMRWARIGVRAAEQLYRDQEKAGKAKYAEVEKFLAEKGFRLESADVERAIEAAVYELAGNAFEIFPADE